jgi:hypothetical protein
MATVGAGTGAAYAGAGADVDEEGDSSSGLKGATLSSLQRLARRLHVPVHDREWAIKVLLQVCITGSQPREVQADVAACTTKSNWA